MIINTFYHSLSIHFIINYQYILLFIIHLKNTHYLSHGEYDILLKKDQSEVIPRGHIFNEYVPCSKMTLFLKYPITPSFVLFYDLKMHDFANPFLQSFRTLLCFLCTALSFLKVYSLPSISIYPRKNLKSRILAFNPRLTKGWGGGYQPLDSFFPDTLKRSIFTQNDF